MRKLTLKQAQAQYPHRYTMEHVPGWAKNACDGNGRFYAPQFRSDQEWYDNTSFPGEPEHKRLQHPRNQCYTHNQTWPLGQWLTQPYKEKS